MVQLARNAVDMCWAEPSVKQNIYAELNAIDCEGEA
jgi:hypothetical protein